MSGGQRSQSGRPGGPWSIWGVHLPCSAAGAGGAQDTPPLALTNPSCLCSPHLPSGVCLDPGIWGKGHLGRREIGGREKVPISRDTSSGFSCPPALPLALGRKAGGPGPTSSQASPAAAQSTGHRGDGPGRPLKSRAQATQPLSTATLHRLCGSPFPGSVFQPGSRSLWSHGQREQRGRRASPAPWN